MSFMDQALESYRAPSADDLEIVLPARREPKKQAEDSAASPELGQHGGSGDAAAVETRSDVVGSAASAPEPTPQRDEPDDGEHTDSTEQAIAARARQAAAQEAESEDAPTGPVAEPEPVEVAEPAVEPTATTPKPAVNLREVLATTAGTSPVPFKRTGFSSGEGTPTVVVKRFPQPAIDKLRLMLAPSVGGEFAESISAPALITAFLAATIGLELDLDENTAAAATAFRSSDPRISVVEDKVDQVIGNIDQLAQAMKLSLTRIADTGNVVDGMEFAMAYLIADRVAGLTTTETNETNVDVAQKKALAARERIRVRAKAQRTIEKERDGRRMA